MNQRCIQHNYILQKHHIRQYCRMFFLQPDTNIQEFSTTELAFNLYKKTLKMCTAFF